METPENLSSYVNSAFRHLNNESYTEITFKKRYINKFIYEIVTQDGNKYKASYKHGDIKINLKNNTD